MKLAPLVFLMLSMNALFIFANFTATQGSITELDTTLTNALTNMFDPINVFVTETLDVDSWSVPILPDVVIGVTNAINLVGLGISLVVLLASIYFVPFGLTAFDYSENTFIVFAGFISVMLLQWINILTVIKTIGFIRSGGSD